MSLDNRDYMRESPRPPDLFATLTPLKIILAVNIAVFILQHMFGVWMTPTQYPNDFREQGGLSLAALSEGRVHTLFTHMFVHANVMHILFNMMMIFFVGRSLEALLGPKGFLFLYFFTGLAAAALQLLFYRFFLFADVPQAGFYATMIGASGAALGLLLAFATIFPDQVFMLIFPIPMRISAKNLGRAALVISVAFIAYELFVSSGPKDGGIAHAAHLGGALAGIAYARFLGFGSQKRSASFAPPQQPHKSPWFRKPSPRPKVVDAKIVATEDFISSEIDPILDKINREGMGSLTQKERDILARGQNKISKKIDGQ